MKRFFLLLSLSSLSALETQAQLAVNFNTTNVTCSFACDGGAEALATGGTQPYEYLWTTPGADVTSSVGALCAGEYWVTVTDAVAASVSNFVTITEPPVLSVLTSPTATTCNNAADGSILINVSGGTPPYAYMWSTGMTAQNVFGLPPGVYHVTVVDANGCTSTQSAVILEGDVAVGIQLGNSDPCVGSIDLQAVVTGGTGTYTYLWSTGETTDNISVTGQSVIQLTVTDGNLCTATATTYLPTVGGEMHGYCPGWLNRGFCLWSYPLVANGSCTAYSGPVTITYDAGVNLGTINPTPDDVTGNVITWNSIAIAPGQQFAPQVMVCVPLTTPCGSAVSVEITTSSSSDIVMPLVLCSYDPNDKQVSPAGVGPEGYIVGTEELTYTIRFQNTGSIPATFIHVIDALDEDLDLFSLRVLASSHSMELSIDENRTLDFFFDNINLPDSTSDLAGSSGFIIYAISPLASLPEGTVIENTAEIYFDFNAPIITNSTVNTIDNAVGVSEAQVQEGALSIYPNPSSDVVTVSAGGTTAFNLQVHNSMGQLLLSKQSQQASLMVDVSQLPAGIYLFSAKSDEGLQQGRFIKR